MSLSNKLGTKNKMEELNWNFY